MRVVLPHVPSMRMSCGLKRKFTALILLYKDLSTPKDTSMCSLKNDYQIKKIDPQDVVRECGD